MQTACRCTKRIRLNVRTFYALGFLMMWFDMEWNKGFALRPLRLSAAVRARTGLYSACRRRSQKATAAAAVAIAIASTTISAVGNPPPEFVTADATLGFSIARG